MTKINPQSGSDAELSPRLDKERVARSFSSSCTTYEDHATVQCALADELTDLIVAYGKRCNRGLEIGCGTGYLSNKLVQQVGLQQLYLNDLAPELCQYSANRLQSENLSLQLLAGDIETLEFPADLELVVSSSTLQWIEDLDSLFAKIAAALTPGGIFAFSLFGAGTMEEINKLSGRGLLYKDLSELIEVTTKHFSIEQSSSREDVLFFPSVLALFRHIRNTGVGGLGQARWTRAGLRHFEQQYHQRFGTEQGLPVSYCGHLFLVKKSGEK